MSTSRSHDVYSDEDDYEEEVELYDNLAERTKVDNYASLFAIMTTCEHLEKAYAKNSIGADKYKDECLKLIGQFKLAEKAVPMSVEEFMKVYDMEGSYPLAFERLLGSGVPATTLYAAADDRHVTVIVQEATEKFITALDTLNLGQRAVDEVQPPVSDLMEALTRVPGYDMDQSNNAALKIEEWLGKLNRMRASDEMTDDDIRQITHDINASYESFRRFLQSSRTGAR